MSNKKKRYKNPLEVRLAIISLRKHAGSDIGKAERLENEIDNVRLDPGISEAGKTIQCDTLRKEANRLRKHHSFLLDRKIPMLVEVLQKLGTTAMPFMKDTSELEGQIK
jgi:hypothetical protein